MLEQYVLYFDSRNVVTGADDQVVGARLEPEVAVFVDAERVASKVPSIVHVLRLLLRIVEIFAAGYAANCKPPDFVAGSSCAIAANHSRRVAMNHFPDR